MASGALTPAVVDVPLGTLSTLPPDHAGPTGRLVALYDTIVRHYSEGGEKRVSVDPRTSFESLTDVLRNSTSGVIESGTWASPSFLSALGDQLLSICSNRPRVYNGTAWTNYGATRVVTQKLSQSVLHATNNTIAAPDSAWIAGVTCSVWTEQVYDSAHVLNTSLWVGFRADDGAWVRVPTLRYTASGTSNEYMLGKVVQDAENFWVFYNAESSGHKIFVEVYDIHGALLSSGNATRNWDTSPGYWDVYGSFLAGVLLVQPAAYNASPTDVHVQVKKFSYSAGSISSTTAALNTAHCAGPVAFLTNDLLLGSTYFATVDETGKLWGYEISGAATPVQTKEYNTGVTPVLLPDSITGWAEETGVLGERNIYLSYSCLSPGLITPTVGPPFDPQLRFMRTIKRTFAGATSTVRTTQSVLQQSRAFAINSEYHAYTYYASGSGQNLPSAAIGVEIQAGDYFLGAREAPIVLPPGGTNGAPLTPPSSPNELIPQLAMVPKNIDGGGTADKVEEILATGLDGVTDGTPVLKWTFKNATFDVTPGGAILKVNASSISTANFQWDILTGLSATVLYTSITNRLGGSLTPGNFTTTGTVEVVGTLLYPIASLPDILAADTVGLFDNGTITVSGASNSGNNGVFTILPGRSIINSRDNGSFSYGPGVWVLLTTQVFEDPTNATIVIETANSNAWVFNNDLFTEADIDSILVIADNPIATNSGDFTVTDVPNFDHFLVTGDPDGAAVVPQNFVSPFPTANLRLPGSSTPWTLHLALVDFDYMYIGALVSIAGANHETTNGTYTIVQFVDSHTVVLAPTNGESNQRSESLNNDESPSEVFIVIQLATNVNQPTQPTWFVTPLTGSQPQVGMFEKGLAYADWRYDSALEGEADSFPTNRYPLALTSTSNPFGTIRQVVLPFRAGTFTQVSIATVGATPIDIANAALASTVGLKIFQSTGHGEGTGDAGKLLVPGLLATEFTASGFAESNFNVGPEAPFIVSQGEDSSTNFALTPGKTYTVQVVAATTLENGDVVRSLPSPAIQVTLTGDNNFAVYGGRLIAPLDTSGVPVASTYGLTNHPQTTYEIYRSVVVDGVPSTQLHLITNPANPNGKYTGSGTGSGFTFPDSYTWNYRDENPDAGIRATEVIYAGTLGQGIAPHFPAPAFTHATTWANRRWVVGYDGAVWMSAELVEGEDPWFFPGFRYPFPEEDPAVCVVGFENFLFMLCAKSIWRIPFAQLPNATLTAGSMPTPIRLPFSMGCTGFAVAMADVVAYSSSVNEGRQVWAITRNLANVYLSEPIEEFMDNPVSGLTVDGSQRLIVAASATSLRTFDPVSREWGLWRMPSSPTLITSYLGKPTYEDGAFVLQQTDSGFIDIRNEVETPVAIDVTLATLSFAAVRAVKRLWEAQILGSAVGDCNINARIAYPDDSTSSPTVFGPTPVATTDPLLLAINPAIEDATSFSIRIFGSFEGIDSPGRCFSLEMLSCEVGLDSSQGLRKLPSGFRLVGG